MGLSKTADEVQEVGGSFFVAVLLSVQESLDSVILKLAPSAGVNSATKSLDVPAHYCEHPWCLHEGKKTQKADRLSGPYT